MSPTEQRIRQLRFAVQVGTTAHALELRRQLRADLYERLLPALEHALDEASPEEQVLSVPRVELRLRFASPEAAIAQLPERIHRELLAALRGLTTQDRAKRVPLSEARRDELWRYLETGSAGGIGASPSASPRAALRECAHEQLGETLRWLAGKPVAAWFRWLQLLDAGELTGLFESGNLVRPILDELLVDPPASLHHHRRLQLAAAILAAQANADAPALAAATTQARESLAIARQPTTLQVSRLEHNPNRAPQAVEPADDHLGAGIQQALEPRVLDTERERSAAAGLQSREPIAATITARVAEPADPLSSLLDAVQARSTARERLDGGELERDAGPQASLIDAVHASSPARERLDGGEPKRGGVSASPNARLVAATLDQPNPSRADAEASSTLASAGSTVEPPAFEPQSTDIPERVPVSAWLYPRSSSSVATPVHAAGLVLLHPFLPTLFTRLRLALPIPAPLPEASLAPAAAILHFLATGEDEPLELELGLIKLLLGLRPDTPLPVGGGLVDAVARDEAQTLLASVIQHWTALGQTSIDGLRSTFLRRFGIVRAVEGGDRLHVETGSFDMLLDRLPWGLGVVKLPWMRHPLFTEWSLT